jgi:TetR/AcrR family transcriptional repressor of nem operon
MTTTAGPRVGTAERILDAAEHLAQTQGFNGFSYADISAVVGVTKASLHYHFPSKAVLGRALLERYTQRFGAALAAIEESGEAAPVSLRHYAELYARVLVRDRMCLCGMLAAEFTTLPPPMQEAVRHFFDANEVWLTSILERGRAAGELAFEGDPRGVARLVTATLEGAMLIARSYGDAARFDAVSSRLLEALSRP